MTNEKINLLVSEYPPTNTTLLNLWRKGEKDTMIRVYLSQWIDIVNGKRTMIDTVVFNYLYLMSTVVNQ